MALRMENQMGEEDIKTLNWFMAASALALLAIAINVIFDGMNINELKARVSQLEQSKVALKTEARNE